MSKVVVKYNPDLNPKQDGDPRYDELRLLSLKQNNSSEFCKQ